MKVVMLCGSPRGAKGNSAYLLDGLGRLLATAYRTRRCA